jgi:hypothetical protein
VTRARTCCRGAVRRGQGSGGFDDQRKEPSGFNLVIVGVPAFTDTVAAENDVAVPGDVVAA